MVSPSCRWQRWDTKEKKNPGIADCESKECRGKANVAPCRHDHAGATIRRQCHGATISASESTGGEAHPRSDWGPRSPRTWLSILPVPHTPAQPHRRRHAVVLPEKEKGIWRDTATRFPQTPFSRRKAMLLPAQPTLHDFMHAHTNPV